MSCSEHETCQEKAPADIHCIQARTYASRSWSACWARSPAEYETRHSSTAPSMLLLMALVQLAPSSETRCALACCSVGGDSKKFAVVVVVVVVAVVFVPVVVVVFVPVVVTLPVFACVFAFVCVLVSVFELFVVVEVVVVVVVEVVEVDVIAFVLAFAVVVVAMAGTEGRRSAALGSAPCAA